MIRDFFSAFLVESALAITLMAPAAIYFLELQVSAS